MTTEQQQNSILTLCLTEGSSRKIIRIASTATGSELFSMANDAFSTANVFIEQLLAGVPPVPVQLDDSLQKQGIRNQDRILVKALNDKKSLATSSTPSKRAAAVKATASLATATTAVAAVAKAGDDDDDEEWTQQHDQQQQPGSKKSSSNQRKHQLQSPRQNASRSRNLGQGRRLRDGQTVATPKKRARAAFSSHDDTQSENAITSLLGAASGGTRKQDRLMRQHWKQAVKSVYEQNQAAARLAAIPLTVKYTVNPNHDNELNIQYPKSIIQKTRRSGKESCYTESVELLPIEVLQSVVAAIYPVNPEALRPENLALLSPRVLWSLCFHYSQQTVPDALKLLQSDLDWSFLKRRKEQLSEKALENLRQQRAAAGNDEPEEDWEAAAAAIQSVERAMDELNTIDRAQKRSRLVAAAEERLTWKVQTPTEEDVDELIECITTSPVSDQPTEQIALAMIKYGIRNWRELANQNAAMLAQHLTVDVDVVEAWLEQAQLNTLEEIMVEICDGQVEMVELLRNASRSGTPKELAAWQLIPEMLHDELKKAKHLKLPPPQTLQIWCTRAKQAVEQLEWLGSYATPIED